MPKPCLRAVQEIAEQNDIIIEQQFKIHHLQGALAFVIEQYRDLSKISTKILDANCNIFKQYELHCKLANSMSDIYPELPKDLWA